jgi:SAM-dependent methyltransferase
MLCRLCGADTATFQAGGTTYSECPECSYLGVDPDNIPSPEAEAARYRLHRNSYDDERYRFWIAEFLDATAAFLPAGARVLDFGSGPEPVPARLLAERGCSVTIYDPFFAPGDAWRQDHWDAILVHEVAEHLAHPLPVFAELAGLLVPGGALCVRTRFPPVHHDAGATANSSVRCGCHTTVDRTEFARWRYRMDETHVGFFGERSMQWLASRLGLDLVLLEKPDRTVFTHSL